MLFSSNTKVLFPIASNVMVIFSLWICFKTHSKTIGSRVFRGRNLTVYREDIFPFILLFPIYQLDTQRHSRTSGQDTPTAGTQCLFAPTAGTQCLSRLRRSLRKQTARSLLSASYGKALQKQAKIFIKATIAAPPHVRNRSIKYRRTQSRELPGLDPCCLLGKSLPFHFPICSYAIVTVQCLTAFWPGRVV